MLARFIGLVTCTLGSVLGELGNYDQQQPAQLVLSTFDIENISEYFHAEPAAWDQLQPGIVQNDSVHSGNGALSISYQMKYAFPWGNAAGIRHLLPGTQMYSLQGCNEISFQYKVVKQSSHPQVAKLRLILVDGTTCSGLCNTESDIAHAEYYYSFHDVLDDPPGHWFRRTLQITSEGDNFRLTGWFGAMGNRILNKESVKGFIFEIAVGGDQALQGEFVSGEVLLDGLECTGPRVLESPFMLSGSWLEARQAGIWPWLVNTNTRGSLQADWAFGREWEDNANATAVLHGAYAASNCPIVGCFMELYHVLPGMAYYNFSSAKSVNISLAVRPTTSTKNPPLITFSFLDRFSRPTLQLPTEADELLLRPPEYVSWDLDGVAVTTNKLELTHIHKRLPKDVRPISGFKFSIFVGRGSENGGTDGVEEVEWGGVRVFGNSTGVARDIGAPDHHAESWIVAPDVVMDLWADPSGIGHSDVETTEACAQRCLLQDGCIYFALRLPAAYENNCMTSSRLDGRNVFPGQIRNIFKSDLTGSRFVHGYSSGGWLPMRRPLACTSDSDEAGVCTCSATSIVCSDPSLQITPLIDEGRLADLEHLSFEGSPIPMITEGLLPAIPNLQSLRFSSSVRFLSDKLLRSLSNLQELSPLAAQTNLVRVQNKTEGSQDENDASFSDICCGRSDGDVVEVAGESFWTCQVDGEYGSDCFLEPAGTTYEGLSGIIAQHTASDPRWGTYTQSAGACCELCRETDGCNYWIFDNRPFQEAACILKTALGRRVHDPVANARIRAGSIPGLRKVRMELSIPRHVLSDDVREFDYDITLVGEVARGEVWVKPYISPAIQSLSVYPETLIFFNNSVRRRTVRVVAKDTAFESRRMSLLTVRHSIAACDTVWKWYDAPFLELQVHPVCSLGMRVSDVKCVPAWGCITLRFFMIPSLLMLAAGFLTSGLVSQRRVKDVSTQEGHVMLETCKPHGVTAWGTTLARIVVLGSDSFEGPYLSKVLGPTKLELFDVEGKPLQGPAETSHGFIYQPFPGSLLRSGIRPLPVPCFAIILGLVFGEALACLCFSKVCHGVRISSSSTMLLISLALSVVASYLVWLASRIWPEHAPLDCSLETYCQDYVKEQACPRGPLRGVCAGDIQAFCNHFQPYIHHRNMYYVVTNLIYPLTRPSKLSMAELIGCVDSKWFVSHYWGSEFQGFVQAICQHARGYRGPLWSKVPYWVCSFSINQWSISEEVGSGDWRNSSFYKALHYEGCSGTLMVLDSEVTALTRSWCLFELIQSFQIQNVNSEFGFLFGSASGVLNHGMADVSLALKITNSIATIDLRHAEASNIADKKMIHDLVEATGGFHKYNLFIQGKMHDALREVQDAVEEDFRKLELQLVATGAHTNDEAPDVVPMMNRATTVPELVRPNMRRLWSEEFVRANTRRCDAAIARANTRLCDAV